MGPTWDPVVATARELLGLVVPLECAGCGAWDVRLCAGCRALLTGGPRRVEEHAPRLARVTGDTLPVWAAASYAGAVRETVVAWKDRGRADVTTDLTTALAEAVRPIAGVLGAATAGAPLAVVPVPSRASSRRRRGADLTALLAAAVVGSLQGAGVRCRVERRLTRRGGLDQVGLGARARARNTAGTWVVRRPPEPGASHILVDDVLTTGSTLAGCASALSRSGGLVLGAVVLAATPRPGQGTDGLPGPAGAG